MTTVERRDVESALRKKGFVLEETDHRYYKLQVDGKYTGIQTKVSTGTKYKTLAASLVGLMAGQLRLSKAEFLDLVRCSIDGDAYVSLLEKKGLQLRGEPLTAKPPPGAEEPRPASPGTTKP